MLLAIDPGPKESGYVILDQGKLREFGKVDNHTMLKMLESLAPFNNSPKYLALEMIAPYGTIVGAETFNTCFWIGRFFQAWDIMGEEPLLIFRRSIKKELCGTAFKKKDKDVREAIIKIFGGKQKAIGNKKTPGPLYGMIKDAWQALAVGIYASRQISGKLRSIDKQLELKSGP